MILQHRESVGGGGADVFSSHNQAFLTSNSNWYLDWNETIVYFCLLVQMGAIDPLFIFSFSGSSPNYPTDPLVLSKESRIWTWISTWKDLNLDFNLKGYEPGSLAKFQPGKLSRVLWVDFILEFPVESPATLLWTIGQLKQLHLVEVVCSEVRRNISDYMIRGYLDFLVWDYLISDLRLFDLWDYLIPDLRLSDIWDYLISETIWSLTWDTDFPIWASWTPPALSPRGEQIWPGCANICLFAVY